MSEILQREIAAIPLPIVRSMSVRIVSEAYRAQCEERHVAALSQPSRVSYCDGVKQKRGYEAAVALYRAALVIVRSAKHLPTERAA